MSLFDIRLDDYDRPDQAAEFDAYIEHLFNGGGVEVLTNLVEITPVEANTTDERLVTVHDVPARSGPDASWKHKRPVQNRYTPAVGSTGHWYFGWPEISNAPTFTL